MTVRPAKCFLLRNLGKDGCCENAKAQQQQKKQLNLGQALAFDVVNAALFGY
jgi:hypothetical protein